MNISPQIESVSTEHLLTCLGLAIDEAKLTREIIQAKDRAHKENAENHFSHRLILINREIELLEAKLAQVRSQANRGIAIACSKIKTPRSDGASSLLLKEFRLLFFAY